MKILTGKHRKEIEDAKREIFRRLEGIKYAVTYFEHDPEYFLEAIKSDVEMIMETVNNEF